MTVETASAGVAHELRVLLGRLLPEAGGEDDIALTSTQRLVLTTVVDGVALRLGALAERVGVSCATASRAVEALVVAGLVERVPDADDRRAIRIDASGAGRAYVERRRRQVAGELAAALAGFDPSERDELLRLLQRLNAALAER
jgi:DNA-binding MarR family transcriptional regulator